MNRNLLTSKINSINRPGLPQGAWLEKMNSSTVRQKRLFLAAVIAFVFLGGGFGVRAQQREVGKRKDLGDFNLTLVGDNIIYTQATVHQGNPKFMAAVKEIRTGDAAFANFENNFPGPDAYPGGAPRSENLYADPSILKELQWIGFNLFGTANNHSMDYGIQGVLDTIQTFKKAGAVYAGTGVDLGHARAAGYLSTPHGRVGLIACASTFPQDSPAGQTRPDVRGRPGLDPLRYDTRYRVSMADFEALKKLNVDLKMMATPGGTVANPTLTFVFPPSGPSGNYGTYATFEQSDKPGVYTTPDRNDLTGLTHSIQNARYFSDYVVASIHAHEGVSGQPAGAVEIPAQFVEAYAHAAIDAGADVFVGSGPHILRGIEIYKGKVIFYSLGSFIMEDSIVEPESATMYDKYNLGLDELSSTVHNARSDYGRKDELSWPLYWQSAIAHVVFRDGRPAEVKLTPVILGYGYRAVDGGWPEIADVGEATQILEHLQKLSEPYGTKIAISNGIGTITLPK